MASFRSLPTGHSQKLVKSVLIVAVLLTCAPAFAQKRKLNWPKISFRDGLQELPADLTSDLPFSLANYYDLKDDENREQLYLQILAEYASTSTRQLQNDLPTENDFYNDREFKKSQRRFRKYQEQLTKLFRDEIRPRNRLDAEQGDLDRYLRLAARFDPLFAKMELAQQRPNCFFHRAVLKGIGIRVLGEFLTELVRTRFVLEPGETERIDELRQLLHFFCDSRGLGASHVQGYSYENDCFEYVVKAMLASEKQSIEHLDKLIEALKEYRDRRLKIDPALEAARQYYILSRSVVQSVRDQRYRTHPVNPAPHYNETREIMQLVNYISPYGNISSLAELLKHRWQDSLRSADEKNQILALAQSLRSVRGREEILVAQERVQGTIAGLIKGMNGADFDRDLQILKNRYLFIEAACKQDFPESTRLLREINHKWSLQQDWKKSPLLLWCNVNTIPSRALGVLDVNAYLCIAAVKRWRMSHNGSNPENVSVALSAVGINEDLIDPYSGDALRVRISESKVEVDSVGPNGNDDSQTLPRKSRGSVMEFPYLLSSGEMREFRNGNLRYVVKF